MTEDAIRVTPRSSTSEPAAGHRPGAASHGRGRRAALPVTTELLVFAAISLAVLLAAAFADDFGAVTAWTLVTALAAAYIVSRGLAKHEDGGGDHLD